jgi:hypothetical protein
MSGRRVGCSSVSPKPPTLASQHDVRQQRPSAQIQVRTAMRRERHTFDQRPGSVPVIRTNKGGITFVIVPAGTPKGEHLVIRCDADGEVWISIEPDPPFPE